jgi:hypothetical protein
LLPHFRAEFKSKGSSFECWSLYLFILSILVISLYDPEPPL